MNASVRLPIVQATPRLELEHVEYTESPRRHLLEYESHVSALLPLVVVEEPVGLQTE